MRSFNKKMIENNSKEDFLKVRELLNESLFRDVFVFVFLYLFVLTQSWINIFLLLFPIITFSFSIFFRIINSNKYRIFLEHNLIRYNPLGLEKKHASRLNFTALLQLILLFWIGEESYYHPQLIQTYGLFFNTLFTFFFTFGFYWILIDVWKYSKITIRLKNDNMEKVISYLQIRTFKLISVVNLGTFLILNFLNILFALLINNSIVSGFSYILPGTGVENSLPLEIPILSVLIIWISPLSASILLILIYKHLNNINPSELANYLKEIPEENRKLIIQNFREINKKFYRDLNNE